MVWENSRIDGGRWAFILDSGRSPAQMNGEAETGFNAQLFSFFSFVMGVPAGRLIGLFEIGNAQYSNGGIEPIASRFIRQPSSGCVRVVDERRDKSGPG